MVIIKYVNPMVKNLILVQQTTIFSYNHFPFYMLTKMITLMGILVSPYFTSFLSIIQVIKDF